MRATVPSRIAAALLLALCGCGSEPTVPPTDPGSADVSVRLEKTVYSFAEDVDVQSTVYNRGSGPIYVPLGDYEYVYIEQWSDNGWIYVGPWFFADGVGPSFPIAPGDSLVPLSMDLAYLPRLAGTYRFVFRLWLDPHGRWQVPEEQRVAEFRVNWE